MPEYEFTRETDVPHDKVSIKFDHCNFTWGFKIKQLTEEQKKEKENNKKNKDDQYKIEVDDVRIICTGFLFRDKTVTIYLKDIESISGGIFEGRYRGIMKVCDGKNKLCIGFFDRIKNSSRIE